MLRVKSIRPVLPPWALGATVLVLGAFLYLVVGFLSRKLFADVLEGRLHGRGPAARPPESNTATDHSLLLEPHPECLVAVAPRANADDRSSPCCRTTSARHTLIMADDGSWRDDLARDDKKVEYVDLVRLIGAGKRWDARPLEANSEDERMLFVDHLEFRGDEPVINRRKLRFLDRVFACRRRVIVACAVAPETLEVGSPYHARHVAEELHSQWRRLFRRCRRVYFGTARRADESQFSHFERLWHHSSRSERGALLRISQLGLVSPKRRWAEDRLVARGLVERRPLRLVTERGLEKFQEFVIPSHVRVVEDWESEGRRGRMWRLWSWVPLGVAALLGLFLLATQEELRAAIGHLDAGITASVSVLVTIAAAIVAVRRLVSALNGEAADPA